MPSPKEISREVNTGFICTGRRPRDWEIGGVRGADFPNVNRLGAWDEHLPEGESQRVNGIDVMGCLPWSFLNACEIHALHTDLGSFDFDDRVLAKMSGTTVHGNTMWRVWNTAHRCGLAAQGSWPVTDSVTTFAAFYANDIPKRALSQVKRFKEEWDVQLAWTDSDPMSVRDALTRTPVWAVNHNHGFVIVKEHSPTHWKVYDSYPGGDGDYVRLMRKDSIRAAANVRLVRVGTAETVRPVPSLPEECKVWVAGNPWAVGLHVNGRLYVDEPWKIDLQWQLRNRDRDDRFHGGPILPITPEQYAEFDKVNLKNQPIA